LALRGRTRSLAPADAFLPNPGYGTKPSVPSLPRYGIATKQRRLERRGFRTAAAAHRARRVSGAGYRDVQADRTGGKSESAELGPKFPTINQLRRRAPPTVRRCVRAIFRVTITSMARWVAEPIEHAGHSFNEPSSSTTPTFSQRGQIRLCGRKNQCVNSKSSAVRSESQISTMVSNMPGTRLAVPVW
jgi:hypothetical protein